MLRGKDYCNCDHAKLLREAIETALIRVAASSELSAYRVRLVLERALNADHEACTELWGDLKESESRK